MSRRTREEGPPGGAAPSRRRCATAALALTVLLPACTTTWAEIHGPRFAAGMDITSNVETSPRVEAGYHWLLYKDAIGIGSGGVVAWSPVTGWIQVVAEVNAWMFPLFGFPLTPFSFRLGAAFHPEDGPALAVGFGIGGVLYRPPTSCNPPLEGPWEGCPSDAWLWHDTVYPDMVSQLSYFGTLLPFAPVPGCDPDSDCLLSLHSITLHTTLAWFLFGGDGP